MGMYKSNALKGNEMPKQEYAYRPAAATGSSLLTSFSFTIVHPVRTGLVSQATIIIIIPYNTIAVLFVLIISSPRKRVVEFSAVVGTFVICFGCVDFYFRRYIHFFSHRGGGYMNVFGVLS